MSRIGKKPIDIPQGVEIKIDGNVVRVKGPKGQLEVALMEGITGELSDGVLSIERADDAGTVVDADITDIALTCATLYTIGGTVSGLAGTCAPCWRTPGQSCWGTPGAHA